MQWYTPPFVTWPYSSQNQFDPELVRFSACSSGFVWHYHNSVCLFLCPRMDRSGNIVFDLSVHLFIDKKLYLGHSFWTVSDRAFIFHIYIPWGKTISLVQKSRSSVKVKVKYQSHSFRKNGLCGGTSVSQTHLVSKYQFLTLAPLTNTRTPLSALWYLTL